MRQSLGSFGDFRTRCSHLGAGHFFCEACLADLVLDLRVA